LYAIVGKNYCLFTFISRTKLISVTEKKLVIWDEGRGPEQVSEFFMSRFRNKPGQLMCTECVEEVRHKNSHIHRYTDLAYKRAYNSSKKHTAFKQLCAYRVSHLTARAGPLPKQESRRAKGTVL